MSVNLREPFHIQDPPEPPVELYDIRPETFEAILRDVGDGSRSGLTYDEGTLRLATPVLENIRWSTFEAILGDLSETRGLRLAYDQGRLQFMSPSLPHESGKTLLGRMVETWTLELRIRVRCGGSVTLTREDLEKGVEPDESYWIRREADVRGKRAFALETDPPPDLAIEMDVTHSSWGSLKIYAAMGVPEVWRFEKQTLTIYELQQDGTYGTRPDSPGLPGLSAADVERYMRLSASTDDTTLISDFRDWIRDEVLPRRQAGPNG